MTVVERLRSGGPILGLWSMTSDPGIIDAAVSAGPDFVCLDTQHGASLETLTPATFTAIAHYEVASLVRVSGTDPAVIGRALDLGADGVIVPQVESTEQASIAVAACRLEPAGIRSVGTQTRRVDPVSARPFVAIQIETRRGVEAAADMLAVDGIDAVYVGPSDLGLALGGPPAAEVAAVYEGRVENHREVQAAFETVLDAARRSDVTPGIHCWTGADARVAIQHGFKFTSVAVDTALVAARLGEELRIARSD